MNLDFNKIVEYIASGNLTVLILTCIMEIIRFG